MKFDFENLKVYQKTLELTDCAFAIVKTLPKEFHFSVGSNLIRAALSVANNIAEGNDKVSLKEKCRFFQISSDSARECASVFIVLQRQKWISEDVCEGLKLTVREITSMLQGLMKKGD